MFLLVWPGDNGKQACTTARSIAWHAYHSARFNLGSSGSWNQRVNLFLPSILFLKMLDYQKKVQLAVRVLVSEIGSGCTLGSA